MTRGRRAAALAAASALLLAAGPGGAPDAGAEAGDDEALAGIDVHMHLVRSGGPGGRGGPPRGPGRRSAAGSGYEASADALVEAMDRLGLAKAVVMPPPQSPNQRGAYAYDEILPAIRRHPGRLVLGAGGGLLSPMIMGTDSDAVTPEIRARFEAAAERIADDGARVFGEMAILHFSFHERHVFEQAPADHPLFLLLADVAARRGIPIDVHWEAVPEAQATPAALRERSPNNPARIEATVPGLERLLAHDRRAKIVIVHVGWDNTGRQTPALLRRLLGEHENLFCALKLVPRSYEPFRRGNEFAGDDGRPVEEWVELIRDFPDRFVVGADEFVAPADGRRSGPPSLDATWTAVRNLPADVRAKVSRENAARIYGL